MTGISSRLQTLVEPRHRTTKSKRKRQSTVHRRATYHKGEVALSADIKVKVSPPLLARLERVCARAKVARSVIIRDALDAYLRVIERETGIALTWPKGRVGEGGDG